MSGSQQNYHDKEIAELKKTLQQNKSGTELISGFLTTLQSLLGLPENKNLSKDESKKLAAVLAAINTLILNPTRPNAKNCLSCATELNGIFTSSDSRRKILSSDERKKEQATKGTLAILLLGVCIVSTIVAVSLISGGSAGLLDVAVQGLSSIGGDLFGIPCNYFLPCFAAIVSAAASAICVYRTAVPETEAKCFTEVKAYATSFLEAKKHKPKQLAFQSASNVTPE